MGSTALVARLTDKEPWEVFDPLDAVCEDIATDGPDRLERSRI
jgi:hypothetical protein